MSNACTLIVNGTRVEAPRGMTVVDAALRAGIVIPTDCASGQCETCRVRVVAGRVAGGDAEDAGSVLACQARLCGNAAIQFDQAPVPGRRQGRVSSVEPLAPEILEVRVDLADPLAWLPGQYVKLAFKGYPSRDYSPTYPIAGAADPTQLVFHVKVYRNGAVSSALREDIRPGHRLTVEGPYGRAFYRAGPTRLVLVGTSTGWAPLWAVARTARLAEPDRSMSVVVGARHLQDLYMGEALNWLRATGVRDVVVSCSGPEAGEAPGVHSGRTTDFLQPITSADTIYAAGAPAMVDSVSSIAAAAGAECYADPFTASAAERTLLGRLRQALETSDPSRLAPAHGRIPAAAQERGQADPGGRRSRGLAGGFARWLKPAES